MIIDKLDNVRRYKGLSRTLDRAVDFIEEADFETLDPGLTTIKDKDLFAVRMDYDCIPHSDAVFESHKRYIDIQILLSGEEIIRVLPVQESMVIQKYSEEEDAETYALTEGIDLKMKPGQFALFFPDELHAPKIQMSPSRNRKLVIKIIAE